ncbi:chloramphenicol efflux MFS transporter [Brenneria alni]|uniref:Bcr/CflA family efflux transporter n=1 Tax=Brenneria alni TaxID=71656 RepID=A0A421DKW3_9GAMM|nr:CmlA/FloR family chloramphenicol efflux MFS transporter [Brenneria alni]RLM20448.1 chloramphenicol efflux MFS transporter [Brenneria alni]
MSKKIAQAWAYSLPSTLALMVPFDLLASLAMDVYLPVVPQMPVALTTSQSLIQLTLSAYILILGLGQIIFGPISDWIGRRPVVLGGAGIFAIASFLLAIASSGGEFLALRVFQALGASAALVGTFATVRDVFADTPESTTIYGLFGSILAFVPALGPILGAVVALTLGWRAIFAMLGVMAVLALFHAWPRWHETRPKNTWRQGPTISSILRSQSFWVYTVGFGAAMGAFFVFFSIAPRVLIDEAGWSQVSFSLAFASVALVMIITTRFIGIFVKKWGIPGSFVRGIFVMAGGAIVLGVLSILTKASFVSFVMPMWIIAVGIVFVVSVTANGALRDFGDAAGTAVAMYYSIQSLIVSGLGTLSVLALDGATAWPLVAYCLVMSTVGIAGYATLKQK